MTPETDLENLATRLEQAGPESQDECADTMMEYDA